MSCNATVQRPLGLVALCRLLANSHPFGMQTPCDFQRWYPSMASPPTLLPSAADELRMCASDDLFCLAFDDPDISVHEPGTETPIKPSLCVPRPAGCGTDIGSPCCPGELISWPGDLLGCWAAAVGSALLLVHVKPLAGQHCCSCVSVGCK